MRSNFYPGQLLYGLADPDAVGIKMKGTKRKFALGKRESAGSSTSSSRRVQIFKSAGTVKCEIQCL
jgi:hypothetical protein